VKGTNCEALVMQILHRPVIKLVLLYTLSADTRTLSAQPWTDAHSEDNSVFPFKKTALPFLDYSLNTHTFYVYWAVHHLASW